jgi:hypothetical protein
MNRGRWNFVGAGLLLGALLGLGQAPRPLPPPGKIRQMPPQELRKMLDQLPPDRRKQAEDRLRRYDSLPPAEQQKLDRRYEAFQHMPPERQEEARRLFRRFNELSEDRRGAVQGEFARLHGLSSEEQRRLLQSDDVRKRFNRKEREILSDYAALAPDLPE